MRGHGSGHLALGSAGTGHPRPPARPPGHHRQQQRRRIDLELHPALGGRDRRRLASHRSRQAAAEPLRREIQRPPARRMLNETLFRSLAHAKAVLRGMAARLQRGTIPLEARLAHARGLRHRPRRNRREPLATIAN